MSRECVSSTFTPITTDLVDRPSAFTFFCWVYRTNNNQQRPVNWGENMIEFETGGNRDFRLVYYNGGAYNTVVSAPDALVDDRWYPIGVSATDGDQEIYSDGISRGTGVNAGGPSWAFDECRIPHDASGRDFNQKIAEVAIWGRRLSSEEHVALGRRYSPLFFPRDLIIYAPYIDKVADVVGRHILSDAGTTVADHPPGIIYPSSAPIVFVSAAAGRVMGGLAGEGGLAGYGGLAGIYGGLAA